MKKILMLTVITIVLSLILSACAANKTESGLDKNSACLSDTAIPENTVTPDLTENASSTGVNETPPAVGGDFPSCEVHYYLYHTFPGELINLVGFSEFEKWLKEGEAQNPNTESDCPNNMNLKDFVDHFGITREEYEKACDSLTRCELDRDVFFSGTDAEVDQYFRNVSSLYELADKRTHYRKVANLIRIDYEDELNKIETDTAILHIHELVDVLDIDRKALENYIAKATENYIEEFGTCSTFDYNLDILYGTDKMEAGQIGLATQASVLSLNNDDDPENDVSRNEITEMFCRIGDYAE